MSLQDTSRTIARPVADLLGEFGGDAVVAAESAPTGFSPLDEVLGGGIGPGELMLVGGIPGVGKTVSTLQWARHVALRGHTALYCSYEQEPSALLARLIAMERAEDAADGGALGAFGSDPSLEEEATQRARSRVESYAHRMTIVRCSGSRTGVPVLEEIVAGAQRPVLFVDYLQKIPADRSYTELADRITVVTESLKDLALTAGVPVVAIVASERSGLSARRLRMHHLGGSAALAYESDVVVVLNDKSSCVSKVHLAYDTVRARTFRDWTVFSVEKNRGGPGLVDLEFRKDFAHYRFDPVGGVVTDRLVDDRTGIEE